MEILLRLRHWQLFILLFLVPYLITYLISPSETEDSMHSDMFWVLVLKWILILLFSLSWLYSAVVNLHRLLPEHTKMPLLTFKINFFIYTIAFIGMLSIMLFVNFQGRGGSMNLPAAMLLFFLCLPFICSLIYTLVFFARLLKTVELQRPVTFGEYALNFILLLYMPFGVWFIQPQLNRLCFREEDSVL